MNCLAYFWNFWIHKKTSLPKCDLRYNNLWIGRHNESRPWGRTSSWTSSWWHIFRCSPREHRTRRRRTRSRIL